MNLFNIMLDPQGLNELRNLILQKAGIKLISPSDCQHIALLISKKLNKTISKTTIKRLFGFAATKHNFSKFTINTLLEYVDSADNEVAFKSSIAPTYKKDSEDWKQIAIRAKSISHATLTGIINQCSIPYKSTIPRKYAVHEFEQFYRSNFSFTSLISQSGYGKSILLSHLVQNLFLKPQAKYHNDVVLFINAIDLFDKNSETQHFDVELKKRLNISKHRNLITALNHHYEKTGNKLVIIIDSFHNLFNVIKEKTLVFESIISWLCEIEDSPAIKLVMSMRSYYWVRFYTMIRNSHYLRNKWFPGHHYNQERVFNIPNFTSEEVDSILNNIDHKAHKMMAPKIKARLKHPYCFKFYYALKDEYPQHEYHTGLIIQDIYLRCILESIYRSNQSLEKLILCKKIIQFSNYGHQRSAVDKKLFFPDFAIFKQAYMELLADGILIEHKNIYHGMLIETVSFVHDHIFEYFLFKELLENAQHKMDEEFLTRIIIEYPQHLSQCLLEWAIFTAIRNGDYKMTRPLLNLNLKQQYNYFFLYILENIKHQLSHKPTEHVHLKKNNLHDLFIIKLIQQDFLSPIFKNTLSFFAKLADDKEQATIYHVMLMLIDALQLNLSQIRQTETSLIHLKSVTKGWPIAPVEIAQYLIHKLSGNTNATASFLDKTADFKTWSGEKEEKEITIDTVKKLLTILLILLSYELEGRTRHSIKMIEEVEKSDHFLLSTNKQYRLYLLYALALAQAKLGSNKKADKLEKTITYLQHKATSAYTGTFFMLAKAQQHLNRNEFAKAIAYAHRGIEQGKEQLFTLPVVLNCNILIAAYAKLKDNEKIEKYTYLKEVELEKKGIDKHLIMN